MSLNFELETRRKIYNLIKENPGLYASKIAEMCNISTQLVDYHILYLKKNNLITIEKDKSYKRCFVKYSISHEDKKIISILRQEFPLKIVLYLLKHPYSRHKDLLKELNVSSPRFSYHLKKLIKNGIIEISSYKDKKGYKIINEKEIINLIIRYKPSIIAEKIKDTWIDFIPGKKE